MLLYSEIKKTRCTAGFHSKLAEHHEFCKKSDEYKSFEWRIKIALKYSKNIA